MGGKLELDAYAHLESPIHAWEPRCKLIGLAALIFAFAFVEDWRSLPAMLAITGILYATSHLPLPFLLNRLRYPGFFLLGIILLLPFLSGETVIWQWGALTVRQEGCIAVLLIVCRFFCILTLGLILLNTSPFLTTIKAMRSLGLPALIADMTLLTYRYLYEIADNLTTMQTAMRLRGFGQRRRSGIPFLPSLRNLKLLASLAGTLLIRSYERSERLYKAMRLRGYGNSPKKAQNAGNQLIFQVMSNHSHSLAALGCVLLVAAGFVIAEIR
jgi:cobalt/nickel transport system permease protein